MCGRGLAGRERATNIEGAGPQLSDDQQRSHPGNESSEGSVSQLGNFVWGAASLRPASSHRVVEQDWRSGRPPAGLIFLPTHPCSARLPPIGPEAAVVRQSQALPHNITPPTAYDTP